MYGAALVCVHLYIVGHAVVSSARPAQACYTRRLFWPLVCSHRCAPCPAGMPLHVVDATTCCCTVNGTHLQFPCLPQQLCVQYGFVSIVCSLRKPRHHGESTSHHPWARVLLIDVVPSSTASRESFRWLCQARRHGHAHVTLFYSASTVDQVLAHSRAHCALLFPGGPWGRALRRPDGLALACVGLLSGDASCTG